MKLKYVGLVTVRTSSTRLPNKCLLPFGEETVVTHVVKRAISYGIDPIICTSIDPSDDILEDIGNQLGVRVFRGSMENKLKRWLDCARKFGLEYFHSIDADDPFFDGAEMIRSLDLLSSEHCDVVCPTVSSAAGGASVGFSLTKDVIEKALVNVDDATDTEMMWYYLEKVKGVQMKTLPEINNASSGVRLTLDYEEDYWLLVTILRILGEQPSRHDVNKLFRDNPDLSKINFFRNYDWKKGQLSKQI
jgi:spore coat polysaccharide biosynthesis protein SpsF